MSDTCIECGELHDNCSCIKDETCHECWGEKPDDGNRLCAYCRRQDARNDYNEEDEKGVNRYEP